MELGISFYILGWFVSLEHIEVEYANKTENIQPDANRAAWVRVCSDSNLIRMTETQAHT